MTVIFRNYYVKTLEVVVVAIFFEYLYSTTQSV